MSESKSPEEIFVSHSSKLKNIRFIKNENDERKPHLLSDDELEIFEKQCKETNKNIVFIAASSHEIKNIAIQLGHTLSSQTIDRGIILIEKTEHIHPIWETHQIQIKDIWQKIICVLSMEEHLPNQESLASPLEKIEKLSQPIFIPQVEKLYKSYNHIQKMDTQKPQKPKQKNIRWYRTTKK